MKKVCIGLFKAATILFVVASALSCNAIQNAINAISPDVQTPDFQLAVSIDGKGAPDNVRAGVAAVDKDGNSVALTADNIRISESSDRNSWQEVTFSVERRSEAHFPISAACAMDYSGSMSNDQLKDVENAVLAFAGFLQEGDRMAIIKFASEIEVKQDFTNDSSAIASAVHDSYTGNHGSTKAWDASAKAVDMAQNEDAPKAVITLTDGEDNDSKIGVNDLIDHAIQAGVPIYTLAMTGNLFGIPLTSFLPDLIKIADKTGGLFFEFPSSSDVESVYQAIARAFDDALLATWSTSFSGGTVFVKVDVTVDVSGKTYTDSVVSSYTF